MSTPENRARPWYDGVTRYQWLVLIIASLGWVFDVFEGQIFVASMREAMPSLLVQKTHLLDAAAAEGLVSFYNGLALAAFMIGGAIGGVVFGMMSDRIGRTRTMVLTIATYSLFTFISALAQAWWQLVLCRFLVALGVGGEWAVASAMVAEVFSTRARAWSLAIFHASSVIGTCLAIAAGSFIIAKPELQISLFSQGSDWRISGWRLGFVLGGIPALLIIWIRLSLREPQNLQGIRSESHPEGRPTGLAALLEPGILKNLLLGIGLAAVGMATFWGVHIYGKDLMRRDVEHEFLATLLEPVSWKNDLHLPGQKILADVHDEAARTGRDGVALLLTRISNAERAALLAPHVMTIKRWEMIGMLLVTLGGGLGLVAFGPLSERFGRMIAFLLYQLGGLAISLILFQLLSGVSILIGVLPIFGFLTLGMHAGFAVYFPELFPTRLRGTGTGICFNVGRLLAAPVLILSGSLQHDWHFSLENAASVLSCLFLAGTLLLLGAPETRGRELPD